MIRQALSFFFRWMDMSEENGRKYSTFWKVKKKDFEIAFLHMIFPKKGEAIFSQRYARHLRKKNSSFVNVYFLPISMVFEHFMSKSIRSAGWI